MLKITDVKATCGCTVVQLEKREYAPGESGVIKVTYTAGSTPGAADRLLTDVVAEAWGG
jgi:hypothetical protein